IKLRINKEYKNFVGSGENGGRPMYSWSMDEIATELGASGALQEALELINVVPNPYNAFSEYERNKIDNRIKITNLPEKCTISIYTTNGKLVQRIEKDSPVTYQDWILTNHANIPVASGIYLIHVEVPGIGDRVLKAFIAMRMVDLQNF
ncbi:MAG: T9SS C-terminal target domain-containing protein, partial [Bacteroidota bacterium]